MKKRRLKTNNVSWKTWKVSDDDKPRIRMEGYWLKDAGFDGESYYTVSNPEPGVLVLEMEKREQK